MLREHESHKRKVGTEISQRKSLGWDLQFGPLSLHSFAPLGSKSYFIHFMKLLIVTTRGH